MSREVKKVILNLWLHMTAILILEVCGFQAGTLGSKETWQYHLRQGDFSRWFCDDLCRACHQKSLRKWSHMATGCI